MRVIKVESKHLAIRMDDGMACLEERRPSRWDSALPSYKQ